MLSTLLARAWMCPSNSENLKVINVVVVVVVVSFTHLSYRDVKNKP